MLRRITIDSIGPNVAVTPFAIGSEEVGLSAKVAPVPSGVRTFRSGPRWPQFGRSIERYTDFIKRLRHCSGRIEAIQTVF